MPRVSAGIARIPTTSDEGRRESKTGAPMHVEYDADSQRFKIQKEHYGPVAIVNFSQTFDSFEVIDDQELVV